MTYSPHPVQNSSIASRKFLILPFSPLEDLQANMLPRGDAAAICYHFDSTKSEVVMAQILVRNLEEGVVKRLKARARKGGRSLQAEAKAPKSKSIKRIQQELFSSDPLPEIRKELADILLLLK